VASYGKEFLTIIRGNTYANVATVVVIYFFLDYRLSRIVLMTYFVSSTVIFVIVKLSLQNMLRFFRREGFNLRHAMLVGNGESLVKYVQNMHSFPEAGIRFMGWGDSSGLAQQYSVKEVSVEDFGQFSPDLIIIGYRGADYGKTDQMIKKLFNGIARVIVLPDMTYSFVGHHIDEMAGVPALVLNDPDFSSLDLFLKRSFDIVCSFLGLLILLPLLIGIAIAVKLSSKGPVFFGQDRLGLDGRKFKMWKFRSMRIDLSGVQQEPGWTVKNDPRKTKIGSFIRASSLDELPQLWNVFLGQMSLVGPRPEQPYYVEKFRHQIPAYMLRHRMKAGMTGWAQVNGWRGDTSLHKRIECDLYYIRNWSLWLDAKILLMTMWKGFVDKNAY
jgi:Undecaprenyl-phosphate glucose phosphotransferase